jgi:glycine/D-amino acid oxidase-like deaminating enzyme
MPQQVHRLFDWVDPEAILGGSWCPSDGFLRPEIIYTDAADACRRGGANVVVRAPVVEASHNNGLIDQLRTPKGWFGGDLFLDCTNAWTTRVGALLSSEPLPVAAYKRYLWFISRGDAMDRDRFMGMPLVIAPTGTYFRPENPGSLMVGWAHDAKDQAAAFTYADQDTSEEDFYHASGVDARPFHAWMNVADVVPEAMDFAGITATTSGFYGTTPDHNPFLDFDPRVANLLRLVGFSGHGAMFGPFTALVAAALAEAGQSLSQVDVLGTQASIEAFRIGRPLDAHELLVI